MLVQTNQTFPSPEVVGEVASSNLHGLEQRDMIIISAPSLVQQAERLAVAHREKDGLTVEVVTPEAIYNEFSSGTPDATAYRRLMKMFYDLVPLWVILQNIYCFSETGSMIIGG